MIKIRNPFYVDVDDTLVCWNISEYDETTFITIEHNGYKTTLMPHEKNINLLKKFAKLGYTVIVHSQSGMEWAEVVVKSLGLEEYVSGIGDKPKYYMDDLPASAWMTRLWRDVDGKE